MSITPDWILAAIMEQVSSPEEQRRLMVTMEVVSGKPARNMAMRWGIYPAPDCRLLPTAMSSTSLGSSLALATTSLRAAASMTYGAVSLRAPRLALVMGVRTAEQMTTSSEDLLEVGHLVRWAWMAWSLSIGDDGNICTEDKVWC
jgi:hypothetical protein